MAFGSKNHLIGLDIGSRTLKAGEIVETKKGHRLKKFGMIDIPAGLIEDGVINDHESVADYIRQLFKKNKLKEQKVAGSIGGFFFFLKKKKIKKYM